MRSVILAVAALGLAGMGTAQTGVLIVNPGSLVFNQTGNTPPPAQVLNVAAKLGVLGLLNVTASGGSWLSASSAGAAVTVGVNTAGLAPGTYLGQIGIGAAGFALIDIPVTLDIVGDVIGVSPSLLNLSAIVGGSVGVGSNIINIFDQTGAAFSWTASADQPWLTLSATSGVGAGGISVGVNAAFVTSAGNLTGHVTVTDTTNSTTAIATVNLAATAGAAPNFQLGGSATKPGVLNFTANTNLAIPGPQSFFASNFGGGGALNFNVSSKVISPAGGNWLSVTPSSNTTPASIAVNVNPAGLQPGTYVATISATATSGGGSTGGNLSSSLPVYLTVLPSAAVEVSQPTLQFTSSLKQNPPSPSPASASVALSTQSASGYPFTANVVTASGGNWLTVSPSSGTATNGSAVSVAVDPTVAASLSPGLYTGQVQLNFGGGAPKAQSVVGVSYRVLDASQPPSLSLNQGGLEFTAATAGAAPPAQNVQVVASSVPATGLKFNVKTAVSSPAGGTWLSAGTTSGTATSAATSIPVSVNATGLTPGTYTGTVTVTPDPTTNAPVQTANVNLIVGPASGSGSSSVPAPGPLVATITSPAGNFNASAGLPVNTGVQLNDSQGNPVPGATVSLNSSNGEPAVTLNDLGNGLYANAFVPQVTGPLTLSVNSQARSSTGTTSQSPPTAVTGTVSSSSTPTPNFANGVVSNASYAPQPTPLTPGSLVSVFGYNIAGTGGTSTSLPLQKSIGGTTVTVGGYTASLLGTYPASTTGQTYDQINLPLPFELSGQTSADMVITSGGVSSAPQTISLGPAPALFTQTANGAGDGSFQDNTTGNLITSSNSATAGQVIRLYSTGLGDLQTPLADGTASSGADNITGSINVTIGGLNAPVAAASAAPGFVGVYQINVTVPAGLSTGENKVTVFTNGSPTTGAATIALH